MFIYLGISTIWDMRVASGICFHGILAILSILIGSFLSNLINKILAAFNSFQTLFFSKVVILLTFWLTRILFQPIFRRQGNEISFAKVMILKPHWVSPDILWHVYRECKTKGMATCDVLLIGAGFDLTCHFECQLNICFIENL